VPVDNWNPNDQYDTGWPSECPPMQLVPRGTKRIKVDGKELELVEGTESTYRPVRPEITEQSAGIYAKRTSVPVQNGPEYYAVLLAFVVAVVVILTLLGLFMWRQLDFGSYCEFFYKLGIYCRGHL